MPGPHGIKLSHAVSKFQGGTSRLPVWLLQRHEVQYFLGFIQVIPLNRIIE